MKSRRAGRLGVGVGIALGFAAMTARAQSAPDYGALGSYATTTTTLASGVAGSVGGYIVVPNDPGPFPLLIASHGWSADADQQVGWAAQFASWGFVVAAPSFPNPLTPDATVDEGIIEQLVTLYGNPATVSPAQGKVDPTRVGLEGHSAGGLASTLAARAITPTAMVLFDPVDANDAGAAAYAGLCGPLLVLFANPSSCNNSSEWSTFGTTTTAAATMFNVVGSTHCDGENHDRGALCGLVCGGAADATRQEVYARYATAFFLANLAGDTQAAATLASGGLSADTSIANVRTVTGTACPSDGGIATAPEDDGGSAVYGGGDASSGSPPPSGSPTSSPPGTSPPSSTSNAGSSGTTAPVQAASAGCGCTLGAAPSGGFALFGWVAGAVVALARSRRRQPRG